VPRPKQSLAALFERAAVALAARALPDPDSSNNVTLSSEHTSPARRSKWTSD